MTFFPHPCDLIVRKWRRSRRHIATRNTSHIPTTRREGVRAWWETKKKKKKKSAYMWSLWRESGCPWFIQTLFISRIRPGKDARFLGRWGWEREKREGGRGLVEHSGRYLDRIVNVLIAREKTTHQWAPFKPSFPMLSPSGFRGPEHRSWSP